MQEIYFNNNKKSEGKNLYHANNLKGIIGPKMNISITSIIESINTNHNNNPTNKYILINKFYIHILKIYSEFLFI